MRLLTKLSMVALSAVSLAGCSCLSLFGGKDGDGEKTITLTRSKFIEEGEKLEDKCSAIVKETTKLTITRESIENDVKVESDSWVLVGEVQANGSWKCSDDDKISNFIASEVIWEQKTMGKIAKLMKKSSTEYKDYKFGKTKDGGYVMNDKYDTYTFNSDGVLLKHVYAYDLAGMTGCKTTTYEF